MMEYFLIAKMLLSMLPIADSYRSLLCGIKKIIKEIERVLKKGGECYLTLCSKETWGFKQEEWPLADENTRIRMDDGAEKGIPHFYADYDIIIKLFKNFEIQLVQHIQDFYESNGKVNNSYHYHVLIKKIYS